MLHLLRRYQTAEKMVKLYSFLIVKETCIAEIKGYLKLQRKWQRRVNELRSTIKKKTARRAVK